MEEVGGGAPEGFQFSPFMIGLLGIVAGSVMVITYQLIISLGCCFFRNRRQPSNNEPNNVDDRQQEWPPRNSRVIRRSSSSVMRVVMPILSYSKEGDEEDDACCCCAVCLGEFKEGEQVRVLPECSHLFHVPCIDVWLASHSNCPLCRANAAPPPHVVLTFPDSGDAPPPEVQRVPDL